MADADRDNRPDPDALLDQAKRAGRGRLKIFLGAAPGVGKTYAMLETAQERRREGVDVVIGVIETHGRVETQRVAEGLEVVAGRQVEYRGRAFVELDVDAVLARRPALVLIDELAHTNIPGSRHLKRHQDVDELLAAGIDVYSTLNIQHIESLNDVVARITGVRVRETVPDSVLAGADDIELIDLAPEDLIKRLGEGKVYVPEQARRAVSNFFSPGNLTALRELALRHAAERVDAQMVDFMRAHAIAGPWPTRERLVVCIGDDMAASRLVRAAKRVAERRQEPWVAVHVATSRHLAAPTAEKERIDQAMRLAEQLGGEAVTLAGEDVAAELLAFARERNATTLIIARSRGRGWRRLLRGRSVTDRIVANAAAFDLVLIGGEEPDAAGLALPTRPAQRRWQRPLNYVYATLAVVAAIVVGMGIDLWLPTANVELVFLIAVLLVAMRLGRGPSIFASVVSFLAFNFFFVAPRLSLNVADTQSLLAIFFFLAAAIFVSGLAGRARQQIETTRFNARRTANLYDFSRRIAAAANRDDVLWAVVHHVAATMRGRSLVLLPADQRLAIVAGYPPEDHIAERDEAAALWAWRNGEPAGRGSTTMPSAEWLFVPLKTGRGGVGVLGVQIDGKELLSPDESRLLETLADQAAVAIERTSLVADVEAARLASETERLRAALLSSLSHDLRTPLVSILGAATSMLDDGASLTEDNRRELAETIHVEAERLNRFVQNLLDMTRLGSGALKPKADWCDLSDIVGRAVERAGRLLGGRPVKIDIEPTMPLLQLDPVLMEQVFFNLLDNAAKFSPAGAPVTVWARGRDGNAIIEVCDSGPGIPEADRTRVFDMFYRVEGTDKQPAGTGLGLAICQGIVAAHGGTIRAEPGLNGAGACIVIRLPLATAPAVPPAEPAEA